MTYSYDSTICAPATRSGGALSVIRISGPDAIGIADKVLGTASGTPLSSAAGYTLHYCSIRDGASLLDNVVVSIFRAPHSYTGEDSVEISCHGSEYIVSRILEILVSAGATMAMPGEFTRRAFVSGKMDLAQAEAVADLISSQTSASHRIAMNQLKGGFSRELEKMRSSLLRIVSLMELELDFSEEDVEFADRSELGSLLESGISHLSSLISGFSLGNAIKNGVPVAIVGAANAGKSTLLNSILGENRAIVSDIAGTTRDTIEEVFNINGVLFRLTDTAGLRKSEDAIESLGIGRTYDKLSQASLVVALIDLTSPIEDSADVLKDIILHLSYEQMVALVLNKCDAVVPEKADAVLSELRPLAKDAPAFTVSAKHNIGIDKLTEGISSLYQGLESGVETTLVTNLRHLEALSSARDSLLRVRDGLSSGIPVDLVSQDLREALYHLGTITGQITNDEVLGNIFKNFCIGK